MAQPKRYPLPPADFANRGLPIERISAGEVVLCIHRTALGALHFGKSGANRFDDPQQVYGVCYVARTLEGAFAERAVGTQFVATAFLDRTSHFGNRCSRAGKSRRPVRRP
ncbi:MAG: RES domain-containing protein, partial [Rhodoplanes sp.]